MQTKRWENKAFSIDSGTGKSTVSGYFTKYLAI